MAQHFALWANLCDCPEIVGQADHLGEMTVDGRCEVTLVSWYEAERGSKFISDRMLDRDPQTEEECDLRHERQLWRGYNALHSYPYIVYAAAARLECRS